MKKFLALLLALIMMLGMVACGAAEETTTTETTTTETEKTETTETEETETTETEETETTETEETEEREILSASAIVFTSTGFTPVDDSWGDKYILENYGLDLEILPVDSSTDESWNIFWAGGGYSDIILPYNTTTARDIVNQDICRTIEFDWLKEYAPRTYTLLQKVYGDDDAIKKELNVNGETWCIPYFSDTSNIGWVTAIRTDWLEAVGLEAPATVEEYGEMLRAFTEDDPDGNGIDDTYGASTVNYGLWNVAAAFGTAYDLSFWVNDDNTAITSNATTEEYREYLRTVREWYANGWIDPESITDDRTAVRNKWATGKLGAYCDNPWWFEYSLGEIAPLHMICMSTGLAYDSFTFVGGLLDANGEPAIISNYGTPNGQASVYFGDACPDEVVIRMMEYIDDAVVLYDGSEEDKAAAYENAVRNSGEEGVHWEVGENGYPVGIPDAPTADSIANGWYIFPISSASDMSKFEGKEDYFIPELYAMAQIQNRIYRKNNTSLPILEGADADTLTLVSDYFAETRGQFITGDLDLDEDWDTYVETIEGYGLNDVIEAYEAYFGM